MEEDLAAKFGLEWTDVHPRPESEASPLSNGTTAGRSKTTKWMLCSNCGFRKPRSTYYKTCHKGIGCVPAMLQARGFPQILRDDCQQEGPLWLLCSSAKSVKANNQRTNPGSGRVLTGPSSDNQAPSSSTDEEQIRGEGESGCLLQATRADEDLKSFEDEQKGCGTEIDAGTTSATSSDPGKSKEEQREPHPAEGVSEMDWDAAPDDWEPPSPCAFEEVGEEPDPSSSDREDELETGTASAENMNERLEARLQELMKITEVDGDFDEEDNQEAPPEMVRIT
jgi:hypothetical protein